MLDIKKLKKIHKKKVLNFRKLAGYSGIPYNTLMAKIYRNIELKVNESAAIEKVINDLL